MPEPSDELQWVRFPVWDLEDLRERYVCELADDVVMEGPPVKHEIEQWEVFVSVSYCRTRNGHTHSDCVIEERVIIGNCTCGYNSQYKDRGWEPKRG